MSESRASTSSRSTSTSRFTRSHLLAHSAHSRVLAPYLARGRRQRRPVWRRGARREVCGVRGGGLARGVTPGKTTHKGPAGAAAKAWEQMVQLATGDVRVGEHERLGREVEACELPRDAHRLLEVSAVACEKNEAPAARCVRLHGRSAAAGAIQVEAAGRATAGVHTSARGCGLTAC